MEVEILNPLEIDNWDDLVLATGKASFFHSSAWARVLHESYGYKPVYFCSFDDANLSFLMPFMEVNSWLTGKRGVSLPFTDHCRPICRDRKDFREMFQAVQNYGKGASWKYIEWRDAGHLFEEETALSGYHLHTLNLGRCLTEILADFRDSTRRNIKKAEEKGIKIDFHDSLNSVKEFYRLHCLTRKSHGFPPQPFSFFQKIHEHVISSNKGVVVLASFHRNPVAGAIFLHFGDKVMFKYGASERKYHDLRPNNAVMWEAIRWCRAKSFKSLDFGRTGYEDRGLLQFKCGWGTGSRVILYHKYDLRDKGFVSNSGGLGRASLFARKLPSPIFNLAGSLLYRHIG